jgi:hypothetical protein
MEGFNYRDLQKLAKNAGLRANLPKAELLRALQDHQQQNKTQNSNSVLNTTFEIDPDAEPVGDAAIEAAAVAADGAATAGAADISSDINPGDESLMTEDGEGEEKLNGTFEIIAEEDERQEDSGRRRSNRLSVTGVSAGVLAKETANSPRLQGGNVAAARRIQVPTSRRSVSTTPRAVGSRAVGSGAAGSGAVGSGVKKTAVVPAVVQRLTTPSAVKRKAAEEGVSNIPRFVKFARSGSEQMILALHLKEKKI